MPLKPLMHDSHAYLRWPRLISFTLASSLCTVSGCLSAWALAANTDKRNLVAKNIPGAVLHTGDAVACGAILVAAGGLAAFLLFLMSLSIQFQRRQPETLKTVRIKEAVFAFLSIMYLGGLVAATVVTWTRSASITKAGVAQATINQIVALGGFDLRYKAEHRIVSYIAVGWAALFFLLTSLVLLSLEARHILKNGPDVNLLGGGKAALEHKQSPDHLASTTNGSVETEKRGQNTLHETV
ncbi:hypothetical protein OIO90_001746 [Microbotryomycetes sp. JL221]|nr:hypothetical protein OIO90_001746 [Microbotryomycetes sp. JL221]